MMFSVWEAKPQANQSKHTRNPYNASHTKS